MFTLYSQRMKDAQGNPEVFIYDNFPRTFRNQFFHIISDVLEEIEDNSYHTQPLVSTLCKAFAQEKGLKSIPSTGFYVETNSIEALEGYVDKCNNVDFLDLMDFVFGVVISNKKFIEDATFEFDYQICNQAIDELNLRLKQHGLGYEFINRQIIKKTNIVTHENAVKPTLKLLTDEEFRGAEQEYLLAFEHFRNSENADAIVNAEKAFESTMKIICSGMGYPYDSARATAKPLVETLKKNSFFPAYLESHLNGICTTLESGAPTVRNKTSGHGQGVSVNRVTDEFAEYVLNLVATNILFLYRVYKEKKES